MDIETGKMEDDRELVDVNILWAREHDAEIERGICLRKGRCRCTVESPPAQTDHDCRDIFFTMFVNAVSVMGGISQVLSPREIVA